MKKGIDLFLILVLLVTVGLLVYFGLGSSNTVEPASPNTISTFTAAVPVTKTSAPTGVMTDTPVPTLVIVPTGTATFITQPTKTATATVTPTAADTVTASVVTPLSPLEQEIKTGMERGNRIIQAIEAYHSAKGEYPPTLDVLLPTYLSDIPMTSTGQAYFYRLFDGSSPLVDEVYWVSFRAINQDHVACTYFRRLDTWDCDYASP